MNDLFQKRGEPDDRLAHVHRLLLGHFGEPKPQEAKDPLSQFIASLLSSRTKTVVAERVMRQLRARFPAWEELRDAPVAAIQEAIAEVNFAEQKALNLKASLAEVTERYGSLTLDFLARYRTDKIRAWLEQFPGIGHEASAEIVSLSTLRRRAIPVDAHHLRVTQRLGLTPRADAATTEERLMRLVPETWTAERLVANHALVHQLGQTLCTFADPKCGQCPLLKLCPFGQRQTAVHE